MANNNGSYNPQIHHRRSTRLVEYDYSRQGAYFFTVSTHERECLFGEVQDDKIHLNKIGQIVEENWQNLTQKFRAIELDEFVVMPNHIHGIVWLTGSSASTDEMQEVSNKDRFTNSFPVEKRPSLAKIMRVLKSQSAIEINRELGRSGRPVWQRNYYERIIRDDKGLTQAREYIWNNPFKWSLDRENPQNLHR